MNQLEIINEIAEAKGNDKLILLSKHPELKEILEYTYNPFKRYYITDDHPVFMMQGTNDSMACDYIIVSVLDDLLQRNVTGRDAEELIADWIVTYNPSTAELFKRILNKDLKCGINIKTINKVFPGLIPTKQDGGRNNDVMLLKNYKKEKCKFPCLAAIKKDGVRARFVDGFLYSRQGHRIIGCEHIEKQLEHFPYELDGELCVPGMIFDDVSGLIRNNESIPDAVYNIFDMPHNDRKVSRYIKLMDEYRRHKMNNVDIITHYTIHSEQELQRFYQFALNQDEEGIVIYDPDSLYEDKRSYDWMRMVPLGTEDLECIGFEEGKGKLKNNLGKCIFNFEGKEVKVGTGFKEKYPDKNIPILNNLEDLEEDLANIRGYIWNNQHIFKGLIAEIEFKERTKSGSLRQPRFKRWRFDK